MARETWGLPSFGLAKEMGTCCSFDSTAEDINDPRYPFPKYHHHRSPTPNYPISQSDFLTIDLKGISVFQHHSPRVK